MKRAVLLAALYMSVLFGQSHEAHTRAAEAESKHGGAHGPANVDLWKWANFLLFAGVLGYALRDKARNFFRSRTEQIRRDMAEAARLRQEAEQRCAEIEQRLAAVDAEIEGLRRKSLEEAAAEEARIRRQIELDVGKIQAEAEQEIEAMLKAARQQLRAEAAELAANLAAVQIRRRLSAEVDDRLIRETVQDFERRAPGVG